MLMALDTPPPRAVSAAIERKGQRLESVVAELASRDVEHLDAEQRDQRAEALRWLDEYAKRREFTHNRDYPGRDVPYFIDHQGTRCALAHLLEKSGEVELVSDLARTSNHAYISQLGPEPRLDRWMELHGVTREEIAYIQGPGWGTGPVPWDPERPVQEEEEVEPPVVPDPTPAPAPEIVSPPGSTPAVSTPANTPSPRMLRRKKAAAVAPDWRDWWNLNGDAFVNLRVAYRDRSQRNTPGAKAGTKDASPDLTRELAPLFTRIAEGDAEFAAAGLMALARTGDPSVAKDFVARALAYLERPDARYREFVVLALGVLPQPESVAPLCEILRDTKVGRRHLRQGSAIPERIRSFAAIALGRIGGQEARDAILGTLERESKGKIDLAAACVTALGLVARDETMRPVIASYLIRSLQREAWSPRVLAQVPIALARMGDDAGFEALHTIVRRFRASNEVRQSSAIALGLSAQRLDAKVVDSLMALAHRDPDAAARQQAIMALGEIAYRESRPTYESYRESKETLTRLVRFYEDGISGFFKQPADRAWYALSGALFARRHASFAGRITDRLVQLMHDGSSTSDRAAAALALGLCDDARVAKDLRRAFDATKSQEIRGWCALALGMLRDEEFRPRLAAIGVSDEPAALRGRAAQALAYHGDPRTVPPLVGELERTRSDWVKGVLTRVIGEIGDHRAVPGLRQIALDEKEDAMTRHRALAALGLLAERDERAWVADLKRGFNPAAVTPSLAVLIRLF